MPLSQQAQLILGLRSSALAPSDDLNNSLSTIKKNIIGGSAPPTYATGPSRNPRSSDNNGAFKSFGGRGNGNSNGNWNGFRKDPPVPQYNNVYSQQDETTHKSIPVKVEESDGWTTVATRPKYKAGPNASGSTSSAATTTKYRTSRPQMKATEDAILNTVILGKLNKFSDANFEECKEFLQQILDGDQKDFLCAFMNLVFKKAAMESTFCPLYAKLLGSLVDKYPVILEEMNVLHSKYLEIFDNISTKSDDYDTFVEDNKKKAYRLGYSQFLGELIKLDILSREVLFGIIGNILKNIKAVETLEDRSELVEEYTDCLIKLIRAFSDRGMTPMRIDLNDEFGATIEILGTKRPETKSIPAKARFGFMDCLDILRKK
jgi:hypothetical protein